MRQKDVALPVQLGSLWLGCLATGWEAARIPWHCHRMAAKSSLETDHRNELQRLSPALTGLA